LAGLDINDVYNVDILRGSYNGTKMFHVDTSGNFHTAGTFSAGGADFAELVAVRGRRSEYGPGDVMVIDTGVQRRLALARTSYSTRVAGIYSTKPGVLASPTNADDGKDSGGIPLAVIGIVPCKVTTANGPIQI